VSAPREPDELLALGEPPATPEERAHAASLARRVDEMLEGRAAPPAMDAGERALLETATSLHASLGEAGLAPARERALLDGVLGVRRDPTMPTRRPTTVPPPRPASVLPMNRTPGKARRALRLGRVLPWAVASLCAAAALALWLRTPAPPGTRSTPPVAALRSPDAVIGGPIARAQAGDASARLDALVADRRAARGRGGAR
jgi:hypothetical protein